MWTLPESSNLLALLWTTSLSIGALGVMSIYYLIGKWAGLVLLNLILFLVSGVGIFIFVQWMRTRPSLDEFDRIAVRDEVLVARDVARPE